jgi:hypothetical protein
MTFFGGGTNLPDDRLREAKRVAEEIAPQGSRVQARALDEHYMRITLPAEGGRPEIVHADGLRGERDVAAAVVLWLSDSLDGVELEAKNAAERLDRELDAFGTGVFDARIHLDRVGGGDAPKAYAMIMNTRQQRHTRDEYIWYYRTHHVPLAKDLGPAFLRYSTHRVLFSSSDFIQDAVTLQEFPSLEALDGHVKTRIRPEDEGINDIGNFIGQVDYYIGDRVLA